MSELSENKDRIDTSDPNQMFQEELAKFDADPDPEGDPNQDLSAIDTRPLSGGGPSPLHAADESFIQIAQRSDIGSIRMRNEDHCFSFVAGGGGDDPPIPFALAIVADGMGGHHDGHVISRRVTRHISQTLLEEIFLAMVQGQAVRSPIQEIMTRAVRSANTQISTDDPEKEGGTTLTCALIVGRRLYLIHVGDSRAYLLTNQMLQQLTTDHSIVKRLEEAGHITAEEAAVHPQRNLLYRAITGHDLEFDIFTCSLPQRGKVLICSDGLWGSLNEPEIIAILDRPGLGLQAQIEALVDTALENGSADNVTGIILDFRLR